ncbi:tRNA dihydrouridine(20/20a) synthase DusA [Cohaesibacter sp. CAU 1516]|uniref:tRNA dihydrouridine(20/20a) synthase DusA n=1 Tax=Cohaesibacter sp. CAU 1516 TaxID=2576038 RepID=UPI0010FDB23F|nr:tRNA dihydrouridine(20/20a) synthase DusA [Cohaesibacter sp. CAU 1516]TLP43332.1 tRNA dihydrouridine(20/20a) synthase DusA [Cohaesibacter sp. CAU 1516]
MKKQYETMTKVFSVAPMMEWTDRRCRYFHRQLSKSALLYTEMVTTPAVIHGDRQRLLGFDDQEHPVAVQLGGSDPQELAEATRICADWGYDEINLNVGCPSDRVQSGRFGACLMEEPDLVARCVEAMKGATDLPVTVKCRIGVDKQDEEQALDRLVDLTLAAGADGFTVHARKAWLQGLSPKENRDIPPLNYDRVLRLKQRLPQVHIAINGGLQTLDDAQPLFEQLDGVMLGRAAYHNPALLADVDRRLFGAKETVDLVSAVQAMVPYIDAHVANGGRVNQVVRHMLGLFAGRPGARRWRQILTIESVKPDATSQVLLDALAEVS